jgi:hypothetical protein
MTAYTGAAVTPERNPPYLLTRQPETSGRARGQP